MNLLSRAEVRRRLGGISESTFKRIAQQRDFPGAVRITERRAGWDEAALDAWIKARAQQSPGQSKPSQRKKKGKDVAVAAGAR